MRRSQPWDLSFPYTNVSEEGRQPKTPKVLYQVSAFLAKRQKALSYENENSVAVISASFTEEEEVHAEELCSVTEPSHVGTILSVRVQHVGVFKIVWVESFPSHQSVQIGIFICKTATL